MLNIKIKKMIIKYALVFQASCFLFALASFFEFFVSLYFNFFKVRSYIGEFWFLGAYRSPYFLTMQFFAFSFYVSSVGGSWLCSDREASKKGNLEGVFEEKPKDA